MQTSVRPSQSSGGPHQRKLRNFLLERSFQLKYANFAAAIALIIGGILGLLLWHESMETIERSQDAVRLGQEVVSESQKVSEVVKMNIVRDPVYSENPALKKAFEADAAKQEERLNKQQQALQSQTERLGRQRTQFVVALGLTLFLLVVALWLGAIVLTHRVAGPVYKMRRLLRALEKGNFQIPSGLRKDDELKDFFQAFNDMVQSLRDRQNMEIAEIDTVIDQLKKEVPEEHLVELKAVRERMAATLD